MDQQILGPIVVNAVAFTVFGTDAAWGYAEVYAARWLRLLPGALAILVGFGLAFVAATGSLVNASVAELEAPGAARRCWPP